MADTAADTDIRPYQPQDRTGFARLVSDTLAEYGFTIDPVLEADLDEPQSRYQAIWVATHNDRVVGSIAMRVVDDGTTAELKRMYLRPAFRGRGIGRSLLDQAIGWARQCRYQTIVLDTAQAMTTAQHLYESVGFHRTGSRTEQGAHDARCEVLYALTLTDPASI
jgi:ribosomal protein S18 acetylase RimI-like enzyme